MAVLLVDTWEGQLDLDESVLLTNNIPAAFVRLNGIDGGLHKDVYFDTQWGQSRDAGMLTAPYFVYNPWNTGLQNFEWLMKWKPPAARFVASDVEVKKIGYSAYQYADEVSIYREKLKAEIPNCIYTGEWFLEYLAHWPYCDYWWAQYPNALYPFQKEVWTWEKVKAGIEAYPEPFNKSRIPGKLLFWQFTGDRLIVPGTTRAIDINKFYGELADLKNLFGEPGAGGTPPPTVEEPFEGAEHKRLRAYNSDCHVITVRKGDIQVYQSIAGRATVLAMATKTRAQIGVNGGDYNVYTGDPTGLLAVNGVVKSPKEGYMPWLNITQDLKVTIEEWNSTLKPYNAVALRRMLVRDGQISKDTSPAWHERHPKTAYGVNAAGELIIIEVDGRTEQSAGVTLFELAQLMIEAGAVRAADGGGGGDCTVVINGQVANVPIADTTPGELRPVADSVLVYGAITLNERRKLIGYNQGTTGDLNQTGICRAPNDCSGAGYMITLNPADLALLWKINGITSPDDPKWRWACRVGWFGAPYYKATETSPVQWPYVAICSAIDGSKINTVHVTGFDRGFYTLDLIPANFDPNINPENNRDWFHRCIAQSSDTPQGIFWMPLFSPVGRKHSVGSEGAMLPEFFVDGKVTEIPMDSFLVKVLGVPKYYLGVLTGYNPLNVRYEPNFGDTGENNTWGYLYKGALVMADQEVRATNGDIWWRINDNGLWICAFQAIKNRWYAQKMVL